jgi:pimeloyl-ACP methyl ester carboxylesterase
MATYVLIHGSWHGGWCWNKLASILAGEGHKVLAPDLRGHGNDKKPLPMITLQSYVDLVCAILESQNEPVYLIGRSRGGIVIRQAAERRPNKIQRLVYLAAFMLRNGESMIQWATQDKDCLLLPNLAFSDDRTYHFIKNQALIKDIFYGDCSDADAELAKSKLVPDPTAPIETPVNLTQDRYGQFPKTYIETLQDRAVSPMLQQKMYTAAGCNNVIRINTSHSPFLSQPDQLARILMTLPG